LCTPTRQTFQSAHNFSIFKPVIPSKIMVVIILITVIYILCDL
jgi:hypothetical protein